MRHPARGAALGAAATSSVSDVGYNPYRPRVARRSDLLFVAVAIVVAVALVVWALLG